MPLQTQVNKLQAFLIRLRPMFRKEHPPRPLNLPPMPPLPRQGRDRLAKLTLLTLAAMRLKLWERKIRLRRRMASL